LVIGSKRIQQQAATRTSDSHSQVAMESNFYSVNISDVSGSSRGLREDSETGLYISLLYIPQCQLVASGNRWAWWYRQSGDNWRKWKNGGVSGMEESIQ